MPVCAGASVCVCMHVYALRIVSRDKILRFKNTLIIIINMFCSIPSIVINTTDMDSKTSGTSATQALRTFRVLRAVKTISIFPGRTHARVFVRVFV